MSKLSNYVFLLRPQQYYKNLLIFLGIIFSGKMFDSNFLNLYSSLILGFISLACISSISYIINDWKDIEADKRHPEKKNRPLASGAVSKFEALIILIILLVVTILITFILQSYLTLLNEFLFILILVTLFISSQSYSLIFKNKAFYDVIFISLNYVWRALAGVIIVQVTLSPWLFFLGFLFAMLLALSKRKGDLYLLQGNAPKHKKVFEVYTNQLLDYYIILVSGTLIVSYSIYIVESVIDFNRNLNDFSKFQNPYLMLLTLPLVTIIIMRILFLEISGSEKVRKAELLFFDKEILINGGIIALLTFLALFWDKIHLNVLITEFYSIF